MGHEPELAHARPCELPLTIDRRLRQDEDRQIRRAPRRGHGSLSQHGSRDACGGRSGQVPHRHRAATRNGRRRRAGRRHDRAHRLQGGKGLDDGLQVASQLLARGRGADDRRRRGRNDGRGQGRVRPRRLGQGEGSAHDAGRGLGFHADRAQVPGRARLGQGASDQLGRGQARGARPRFGQAPASRRQARLARRQQRSAPARARAELLGRARCLIDVAVSRLPRRRRRHAEGRRPGQPERAGKRGPSGAPPGVRLRGVGQHRPFCARLRRQRRRRLAPRREARGEQERALPHKQEDHRPQRRGQRQRVAPRQRHGSGQRLEQYQPKRRRRRRQEGRQLRPQHPAARPQQDGREPPAEGGERLLRRAARAFNDAARDLQRQRRGRGHPDGQSPQPAVLRHGSAGAQRAGFADRRARRGDRIDVLHVRGRRRARRQGDRDGERLRPPVQSERPARAKDQYERQALLRRHDDPPGARGLDRSRRRPDLPQERRRNERAERLVPGDRLRLHLRPRPGRGRAQRQPRRLGRTGGHKRLRRRRSDRRRQSASQGQRRPRARRGRRIDHGGPAGQRHGRQRRLAQAREPRPEPPGPDRQGLLGSEHRDSLRVQAGHLLPDVLRL